MRTLHPQVRLEGSPRAATAIIASPADGAERRFPLTSDGTSIAIAGWDVAPEMDHAVYSVDDAVVCVDPTGRTAWRYDAGPRGPGAGNAWISVAFDVDGARVWAYLPEAMADRKDRYDVWVTLDAATGKELTVADLGTDGHGGVHLRHPDGSIVLDVGMGQDGSSAFRGRLLDGAVLVEPVLDRTVCAISPDGSVFLSLSDDEEDIRVHRWPDGHLLQTIAYCDVVPAGHEDQDWWVEPEGTTFADDGRITVAVTGYDEEADDDWSQDVHIDASYHR